MNEKYYSYTQSFTEYNLYQLRRFEKITQNYSKLLQLIISVHCERLNLVGPTAYGHSYIYYRVCL